MTSSNGTEAGASPSVVRPAKYTLQVGTKGQERLGIINQLYNPSTMDLLGSYVAAGARNVLEIACGNGQTANWMAQQLAPLGGRVLATDYAAPQLEIARESARAASITNVDYQVLSVFDLDQLKDKFDLIYCRFILVHIDAPLKVIAGMRERLAPGGVAVCEEATASTVYSEPRAACVDRWMDLWRHLRKANNAQLDLGGQLPALFKEAGFADVRERTAQPMMDTPGKRKILRLNVIETKAAAIETGFATEAELDQLIADLEQWETSGGTAAYMRIHQVSGIAPSR
jgi:ubiquinone/menaquinone biosynthesis C-methylase UbiE